MTKRQNLQARAAGSSEDADTLSTTDQMIAIVDHCTAAKALADGISNRFLAYLLAMTIQEARTNLRPDDDLAATLLTDAPRQ